MKKMKIEILGDGCPRCDQFYDNVLEAVKETGEKVEIVKEIDPSQIAHYGVLSLPGLVVDGVLKVSGQVLNVEKIRDLIK
jgi:small redox-active disulfide protein 2